MSLVDLYPSLVELKVEMSRGWRTSSSTAEMVIGQYGTEIGSGTSPIDVRIIYRPSLSFSDGNNSKLNPNSISKYINLNLNPI